MLARPAAQIDAGAYPEGPGAKQHSLTGARSDRQDRRLHRGACLCRALLVGWLRKQGLAK